MKNQIPESTIGRLSNYLRQLERLENEKTETVRSTELASLTGFSAAQVRKDLAYFGQFGVRGQGYTVSLLRKKISQTLGIHQAWKTVILGAGNLGQALSSYKGFKKEGFDILALFDTDPKKLVSKKGNLPVYPLSKLKDFVKKQKVSIAILAVPAQTAQAAAEAAVEASIHSLLNFAPVDLATPKQVKVRQVDLATELITLAYYSQN